MSDIRPFFFDDAPVRAITDEQGNPWFVAKDVCNILGIENARDAVSRLEEDEVGTTDVIDSIGRSQSTNIISESGLYALIFTSRKDEARRFRKWVTSEVLPALRTTGRYEMPAPEALPPANRASLRLKQTVKATILSCAVQMVKMRDGRSEEVLCEFERLCEAVAGPEDREPEAHGADALTLLFLDRCCTLGIQHSEGKDELYEAYQILCEGEGEAPLSHERFFRDLRRVRPELRDERPRADGERVKRLRGIRLIVQPSVSLPDILRSGFDPVAVEVVAQWASENVRVEKGARIQAMKAYEAFREWCHARGIDPIPSLKRFGSYMGEIYPTYRSGVVYYLVKVGG